MLVKPRKDNIMGIYLEEKEEKNYQAFMKELEKISKKYGIAFEGCGVFAFSDENGFKTYINNNAPNAKKEFDKDIERLKKYISELL